MPGELHEVLENVKAGRLRMEIEHRGLDRTVFKLGRISDRIASTIVLASLIIGSSIVTLSNIPLRGVAYQLSGLSVISGQR